MLIWSGDQGARRALPIEGPPSKSGGLRRSKAVHMSFCRVAEAIELSVKLPPGSQPVVCLGHCKTDWAPWPGCGLFPGSLLEECMIAANNAGGNDSTLDSAIVATHFCFAGMQHGSPELARYGVYPSHAYLMCPAHPHLMYPVHFHLISPAHSHLMPTCSSSAFEFSDQQSRVNAISDMMLQHPIQFRENNNTAGIHVQPSL